MVDAVGHLLLADEFEFSFRFRYVGGQPYTPKVYNHHVRQWYEREGQELNTERYEPYMRFDVMVNKRFYYKKMNLVMLLGYHNLFNRDNPLWWAYLEDGTREMVWQFKGMLSGGMILEF